MLHYEILKNHNNDEKLVRFLKDRGVKTPKLKIPIYELRNVKSAFDESTEMKDLVFCRAGPNIAV